MVNILLINEQMGKSLTFKYAMLSGIITFVYLIIIYLIGSDIYANIFYQIVPLLIIAVFMIAAASFENFIIVVLQSIYPLIP